MARSKKLTPVKDTEENNIGGTSIDLKELEKAGFVMLEDSTYATVDNYIPTGLPALDVTMGGGIPLSRITQFYAKNATGKSMLAVQVVKAAMSMDLPIVYLDTEGTFSKEILINMGVDPRKVFVKSIASKDPEGLTIEAMGEAIEAAIDLFDKRGKPVLFVLDSIGAAISKKTMEQDFDNEQPGIQAKAITKLIQKVSPKITMSNSGLVLLNQIRDSIGGMSFAGPSVPGGRALEHALSLNYQMSRIGDIKKGTEYMGHKVKIKNKKSKLSKPFQEAEQFLYAGDGFNEMVNIIYTAEQLGFVKVPTAGGRKVEVPNEETGEVEKLPYFDFLDVIATPEGAEEYMYFLKPLFQRIVKHYFPDDFPPLHNTLADVTNNPLYQGLADLYKEEPKEDSEDSSEEQEPQTEG